MDLISYLDKSTVLILVAMNDENKTPLSSGTGYFLAYENRLILTSLAHVTDYKDNFVLIKTNQQPNDNGEFPFFHLGGMVYYDAYIKEQNEELIFDERIDFTFEQINDKNIIKQILSENIVFKLEESVNPSKSMKYFFKGSKNHGLDGNIYNSIVHYELEMKYINLVEGYYVFMTNEVVESGYSYKGCSGAAVIEETGRLVGSVAEVVSGTKFIKVFPILRGKNLIDNGIKDKLI